MKKPLSKTPLYIQIPVLYILIAFFIVYISDYLLNLGFIAEKHLLTYHSYRELFFIVLTALLIYFVLKKGLQKITKSQFELSESEKKYREIVENANSAIIRFDLDGTIHYFNEYAENLYGFNAKEMVGKNIYEFIEPYNDNYKDLNKKIFLKKITSSIISDPYLENWSYTKDKKRVFMGWTNKPIYDENKELKGINSIGIDLTEKKIMNDRIIESERKLKHIFNLVSDGIIIMDLNGKIIEQNNTILNALGMTKAEMIANDINRDIFLKLMPGIQENIDEVIKKGEIIFDSELITPNGETMALEIRATKIKYMGKDAIISIGRNVMSKKISQQKIYNAALFAEEKERNRIAKELHDSVSPLLSTIKLYIQTIKECDTETMRFQIVEKTEETINDCIQSITEISNNLSPHVLENFGLIDALFSYTDKISEAHNIEINIETNTTQRFNESIELTIYRVFTELLNNTIKYAKASEIKINLQKINKSINIKYFDNGIGFDKKTVLDTSKGMGLYNITNRIKSLNGKLKIDTKPNKGFELTIKLPIENHE